MIHADAPGYPGTPTIIGAEVTVGHSAVLHGCTLGDGVLVGIRAVVLDGAVVGERTLVGAARWSRPARLAGRGARRGHTGEGGAGTHRR